MEVIAISEAWIDGVRVSHCGVILFIEGFHDEVKSWSICLPKYDGTFKLKFDPEDVQRTFYYPEKEMAGFLLQSSSDTEIQSLIFSMSIDEVSNSFDEFNVFKKTMSLILANKSYRSYTFHTDKDVKKFLTSGSYQLANGEDVWKGVFSTSTKSVAPVREKEEDVWSCCENDVNDSVCCADKCFRPDLRCYVYFITKNPVNYKEGKKIIRSIDDFPKFMQSLSWWKWFPLFELLTTFIRHHKCVSRGCSNFSYLKCQDCRFAYYCSKECQEKDWVIHRNYCHDMKAKVERELLIPKLIHSELQSIHVERIMTFEQFIREIQYKVFECFYDSLEVKGINRFLEPFISHGGAIYDSSKVFMLVRKRGIKSQSYGSLMAQMANTYGRQCGFFKL